MHDFLTRLVIKAQAHAPELKGVGIAAASAGAGITLQDVLPWLSAVSITLSIVVALLTIVRIIWNWNK